MQEEYRQEGGGPRGGPGSPRRIGVVEDHASVVLGLEAMLADQPDLVLAATGRTVAELLGRGAELDLVILDLRLSDGSSPKANVEQLRAAGLEALVYTAAENPYLMRLAARAGVLGIVRKSESPEAVVAAVRAAAHGEQVVTTEWAAAIDGDPDLPDKGLSPRQREVLELYASGFKVNSVAARTGLAPHTVVDYLGRIRTKYAEAGRPAPTKTDLYKRALEDGYLPLPQHPDHSRRPGPS